MLNDGCSLSLLTRHVAYPIISLSSRVVKSSVSFSRVNLILRAIACPEVLASQSTNYKNSSRIIPDWSANLMIRGSCSLLATSVPSSAQTVKNFAALISWESFC